MIVFKKKGSLLYKGYNEDSFCKRLSIDKDGKVSIKSDNGEWKTIILNDIKEIEVKGKVLAAIKKGSNVLEKVSNEHKVYYGIPIVDSTRITEFLKYRKR